MEEITKDGNEEKYIEEKTTDEINKLKGNNTDDLQKEDKKEDDEQNKEDEDKLEKDKKKDDEHNKEDEDDEEPKVNVLESDTNIAKTSNNENVGDGKDNLEIDENNMEKTEDKEEENKKMVEEKTDTDDNEPIDETQDKECSNPILIDVDADHGDGSASLSCNLDEIFATTESEEKGEVMWMQPELLPSVYKFKGSSEFAKKAGGNRNQQRMCLTNMQKAHTEGYCEIDLYHLRGIVVSL